MILVIIYDQYLGPLKHPRRKAFRGQDQRGRAFLLVVVWLFRPETEPVRQEPLPVLASLPEFSLTGQDGNDVTLKDMRGFVWIADFIFTTCAGPCPELTLRMHSLQRSLAGGNKAVKLVSVTTDPNYDTPAVLTRYARRNHADTDMWMFLTGSDEKAIHELIRTGCEVA